VSVITIHTDVLSPYGWTARMIAAEKGVPHEVAAVNTASPDHLRLHPFGKMPVLQHGDIIVYETLAIAHYIDRAFPGPALQPVDHMGQTDVLRWISIVNGYVFPVMNGLIKERLATLWREGPPDEDALAGYREPLAQQLALIGEAMDAHPFLVGDRLTLADCFLVTHLHYASQTPEGAEALSVRPSVQGWLDRMRQRPAFVATGPFAAGA
jgi:glutathione S-transferase